MIYIHSDTFEYLVMNRQHAHELPGPTIAVLYKQIKCISGSRWSAGTMTDLESPKNGKHLEQVHHNKWVPPAR